MVNGERLVQCARQFLGVRFAHQGRHPTQGLDCLGLLLVTAAEAGLRLKGEMPITLDRRDYGYRPDTEQLQRMLAHYLCRVEEPSPGDVLLLTIEGRPQHLALVSDYPMPGELGMIHAYALSRKVVEHRLDAAWRARIHGIYRARD